MTTKFRMLAAVATVAALLAGSPVAADPRPSTDERITITGTISVTPAAGATEVAVDVRTAPQTAKKHFATGIKGTVIIVTLAAGVNVTRNGATIPISDLRASDKVTVTISGRTGTTAPYKYVASKFIAANAGTGYPLTLSGVVAVAPAENATSVMVFVKSYTSTRFTPAINLRDTTIQVALATGGAVLRNGVATTLGGLKLDDRLSITIAERVGTVAPYTYLASRIVATSPYTAQPVTVTGSVTATPAAGATSVSVFVKNVANDVGWANNALVNTVIQVGLATSGVVTRNGEASSISGLKLDDRITMTLTERTGTAAPYLYLASRITATAFATYPFTLSGTLVSIPDATSTKVIVYVKSIVENEEHNAFANALKNTAIVVSPATGAVITRNGTTVALSALRFNDTVTVTLTERTGTAEPYTWTANRIVAVGTA